jgi:hypothetical protein
VSEYGLRTFAAKDDGKVPKLCHVVSLKDLALVGGTVSVQRKGNVLLVLVLARKGDTSTDRDLGADNAVSTIEARGEHVHGSTFAVCDALSPAKQLANDGLDGSSAHESEAVAAVGRDQMVRAFNGVLNSNRNSFLAGGQMAETPDLLLLVQSVGGHFHAATQSSQNGLSLASIMRIFGLRGAPTVRQPCRSTSASALSW